MKLKPVKLREAYKNHNGGIPSFCSILWDSGAHHIITSSSSDNAIFVFDPLLLSAPPKIVRHHRDGVSALALSPNSTCLASGSIDHSVKLYKFPSGEFETNITRFTLPIRTVAFNKSGTMLAAAGDDEGIKLVNTIDGTIARVLKGHKGTVSSVAFDPKGEYLSSIDSTGSVLFWELNSGNVINSLKRVAPDTGAETSMMNIVSWSPDGEMLAVPGLKNDVVMYDRDTAEKLFSLKGEHVDSVCFLSWSPNGKYLTTSGLDNQVLIWDVDKKQDIDRQKFEERICYISWKPTGNALAVIDIMGKYGVWECVIPSTMKSPTEDLPNSQSKKNNGLLLYDEDEQEPSASGSLSDQAEDSHGKSALPSRKRLRKQSFSDDYLDEEINEELDMLSRDESHKKSSHVHKEHMYKRYEEVGYRATYSLPKLQEPFQPGATPVVPGARCFLCYNMLGTITTIANDGYSHIEIDFHDTSQGPRVPSMTDYFGFTMASLNENGSVFASPGKGEKNLSTLMYRPFRSWANNSEWSMRFEEEVKSVALGNCWVAAVTSLNFLRIFTEGGLQLKQGIGESGVEILKNDPVFYVLSLDAPASYNIDFLFCEVHEQFLYPDGRIHCTKMPLISLRYIISLDGPVVTAVGSGDKLAVVTHAGNPLPSSDQMLEFRVFDISSGTQPVRRGLPLSPGSSLTWFGFSEEGELSSYDSKGVLRVYTDQFGGSWLPVFSASKLKKSDERYWAVGLNAETFFCIVCKPPDLYPKVAPKPVLTLVDFSMPLACSDLGAERLENEFIMRSMRLSKIQKTIDEAVAAGQDTTALDDEVFNMEASLDRCILRLIASCCSGDKLTRATELVKALSLEKSVRGAIKLVTTLKLPNLAERFNSILEDRLVNETAKNSLAPISDPYESSYIRADLISKPSTSTDVMMTKSTAATNNATINISPSSESKKASDPVTLLPSGQLTAPLFRKNFKMQEGSNTGKEKVTLSGIGNSDSIPKTKEPKEDVLMGSVEMTKNVSSSSNPSGKSAHSLDARPTNPFAKSSINPEKSSLLDSIKKMRSDGAVRR